MTQPIVQVDAFTSEAFAGNPAGVCITAEPRDAAWMQLVAREMNLAETAFLHPVHEGFSLRWFTPTTEVDLCGHATLASAHVLWETRQLAPDAVARFETRSGLLTAVRKGDWIELDFPATPPDEAQAPDGLLKAVGAPASYVGRSRFDYLLELASEEAVRHLRPDFAALRAFPVRGIIATARAASAGCDFVSRFFAPAFGVDEDPVTGSAHCCLGPYWQGRLNKQAFFARQISERGGELRVTVAGDRVRLGGQAVTVLRGELVDTPVVSRR